jgi:hypothetical protein
MRRTSFTAKSRIQKKENERVSFKGKDVYSEKSHREGEAEMFPSTRRESSTGFPAINGRLTFHYIVKVLLGHAEAVVK